MTVADKVASEANKGYSDWLECYVALLYDRCRSVTEFNMVRFGMTMKELSLDPYQWPTPANGPPPYLLSISNGCILI